jgi:hypothetical protein
MCSHLRLTVLEHLWVKQEKETNFTTCRIHNKVKTVSLCVGVWAAVCELEMTFHITTITVTITV